MSAKSVTGKVLAIAVLMVALILLTTPVGAQLQVAVTVYDTVDTSVGYSNIIVDGGAGDTDGIVNGQVLLGNDFTPIPDFIVQGSYHASTHGSSSILTSGSSSVTNGRDHPVRAYVAVSDTDYEPPANVGQVTGSGTFTSASGSTMYMSYWDDPENTQGANYDFSSYADFIANVDKLTPGIMIDEFGPWTAPDDFESFVYNNDVDVEDVDPFSMTLLFDFSLMPGGSLTARGQAMSKSYNVPEFPMLAVPAGMIVGIAGVVMAIRRTKEE